MDGGDAAGREIMCLPPWGKVPEAPTEGRMRGSLANRTHLPGGCGIPAPHPALRGHLLPMGEGKKNKRPLAAYTSGKGGFLCRRFCRCCWAGMPMSTAWPAAFMNAMACAAWPSAAAPCPRWPTAVWCGSPCRTRRSDRTTSLRPRCWGWRRSTPACPKFSSPAPTTTRPCWPAMPTRCAGRTALPARRPRRCIWPISGSLPRPAAPQGCAHRRP